MQPWQQPLTAVLVNYNSGSFALSWLRSLQAEWARCGCAATDLEVLVVDNDSSDDSAKWLTTLEREGARVLHAGENLGYAGAVQWGLEHSEQSGPVMFSNPDLYFLPGSLQSLMRHLASDPRLGAVAPRAFVDEGTQLHLPPIALPRAWDEWLGSVGRVIPRVARRLARRQSLSAREHWSAWSPRTTDMLSGACVLVSAAVARNEQPLLDPAYPLYYEDADFCRRLAGTGLKMDWVPAARVVHHWSRSAGAGSAFEGQPRQFWARSRKLYMQRWSSVFMRNLLAWTERCIDLFPHRMRDRSPQGIEALALDAEDEQALQLTLPVSGDLFLELSMTPHFTLCAGLALRGMEAGESWSFPNSAWQWLFPGTYYLRAVDAETGEVHAHWTFTKSTSARCDALTTEAWAAPPLAGRSA